MNSPTHGAVFMHVLAGTLRARMARLSTHDPMRGRCPNTRRRVLHLPKSGVVVRAHASARRCPPARVLALFERD